MSLFFQKGDQFRECAASVAQLRFFLHGHFCKCTFVPFWHEHRVIAKAVGTTFIIDNNAFHGSFKLVVVTFPG